MSQAVLLSRFSCVGGWLAISRRPRSTPKDVDPYFSDAKLLSPPLTRPAYSDRMAYVLAEMSDLAYFRFESGREIATRE